ncbi:unnamed protein product, partial [Rotaria socialis]
VKGPLQRQPMAANKPQIENNAPLQDEPGT